MRASAHAATRSGLYLVVALLIAAVYVRGSESLWSHYLAAGLTVAFVFLSVFWAVDAWFLYRQEKRQHPPQPPQRWGESIRTALIEAVIDSGED